MKNSNQIALIDRSENVVIHLNQFAKIEQAESIARACINANSTHNDFMILICCIADLLNAVIDESK